MNNFDANIIPIKGEIVEVFEKESKRFIKIICKPEFLVLSTENNDDVYLGDKVELTININVEKMIINHQEF